METELTTGEAQTVVEPAPPSTDIDIEMVEVPKAGNNRNEGHKKMLKKNFKKIGIDTEAINELYTYGGEQGTKKGGSKENEMMDFENGILELAN